MAVTNQMHFLIEIKDARLPEIKAPDFKQQDRVGLNAEQEPLDRVNARALVMIQRGRVVARPQGPDRPKTCASTRVTAYCDKP